LLHVLQWAKQGAVFTEDTMAHAAGHGHAAVCDYLHAQRCPSNAGASFAAADHCQLGTLQWLLEHGYPSDECVTWRAAAAQGLITVLNYLQQIALSTSPEDLSMTLQVAGACGQLAAA
jgi:hypothetical protein